MEELMTVQNEIMIAQNELLKKQNDNLSTIKHILQFYFLISLLAFMFAGCTVLLGV